MLNWDDEIKLSRREVERARRLAAAPLDEAVAHAENLLVKLIQLDASPERDRLIARAFSLRTERLAIKDGAFSATGSHAARQRARRPGTCRRT